MATDNRRPGSGVTRPTWLCRSIDNSQLLSTGLPFAILLGCPDLDGVFVRLHAQLFAKRYWYSRTSDARSITITSDRPYISTLTPILTVTFSVVQAVNLSFPAISRRQTYVKIVAGDVRQFTRRVKPNQDNITRWDSKLAL